MRARGDSGGASGDVGRQGGQIAEWAKPATRLRGYQRSLGEASDAMTRKTTQRGAGGEYRQGLRRTLPGGRGGAEPPVHQ